MPSVSSTCIMIRLFHYLTPTPLSHSTMADLFSAGRFYLTDSFRAVGQWACHGKSGGHKAITVIGQSIFHSWTRANLLREYLSCMYYIIIAEYTWDGTGYVPSPVVINLFELTLQSVTFNLSLRLL